jgi:hypothetical protein
MVKGEATVESCANEVVNNPIAKTGASNFRNIVLVFKFKKKGIARHKLVPEAYFRKQYLLFIMCSRILVLEIHQGKNFFSNSMQAFLILKLGKLILKFQINFILM